MRIHGAKAAHAVGSHRNTMRLSQHDQLRKIVDHSSAGFQMHSPYPCRPSAQGLLDVTKAPRLAPLKAQFAIAKSRPRSLPHQPLTELAVRDHQSLRVPKGGAQIRT